MNGSTPNPQQTQPAQQPLPFSHFSSLAYLPVGGFQFIFAIFGLTSEKNIERFHAAQALLYWLFVSICASLIFGLMVIMTEPLLLFVLLFFALIFAVPIPIALWFKSRKAEYFELPVIGPLAKKLVWRDESAPQQQAAINEKWYMAPFGIVALLCIGVAVVLFLLALISIFSAWTNPSYTMQNKSENLQSAAVCCLPMILIFLLFAKIAYEKASGKKFGIKT